jgi:hypothetical protein
MHIKTIKCILWRFIGYELGQTDIDIYDLGVRISIVFEIFSNIPFRQYEEMLKLDFSFVC